jgi:hypothetical protein
MLKSALITFVMKAISKCVSVLSMEIDLVTWVLLKSSSSIRKERGREFRRKKVSFKCGDYETWEDKY